jgi:hypothetical protein
MFRLVDMMRRGYRGEDFARTEGRVFCVLGL